MALHESTVRAKTVDDVTGRYLQQLTENGRVFGLSSLSKLACANALAEETHRLQVQAIQRGADAPTSKDARLAELKKDLDKIAEAYHSPMELGRDNDARFRVEAELSTAIARARSDWRSKFNQL